MALRVIDLMAKLSARLGKTPAVPFLDAVNLTTRLIADLLIENDSDLVHQELSLAVLANAASSPVPLLDSMRANPYVLEDKKELAPVMSVATKRDNAVAGTMQYYELKGATLSYYPPPKVNKTIIIDYKGYPADLASMTADIDTLFAGKMSFIYPQVVIQVQELGLKIMADPGFKAHLAQIVNKVNSARKPVQYSPTGYF